MLTLIPLIATGIIPIFYIFPGLFLKKKRYFAFTSMILLTIAIIFTLIYWNAESEFYSLRITPFSQFFSLVFLTVALFVCLSSLNSVSRFEDEYYFLILLSTFGMMVVSMSSDFIMLFIAFEIASIATYALAGFEKGSEFSVEAAFKYFIFGGFSSALLLFGISIVYGYAGSVEIASITRMAEMEPTAYSTIGLVMIVAGFGFKSALVPFHMWAPDTYHGSPTPISALLASSAKKMGFAGMFKVMILMALAIKLEMYVLMAVIAVITMTLGNLAALMQESIKRMLAYSSIAHAGYISMAFAIFAISGMDMALAGAFLHVLSHAIATACAFVTVAYAGGYILDKADSFNSLGRRKPLIGISMSIILLSLAGIPPTLGFYSKFVLFLSAIEAKLLWLALIALLNSALSLYYYSKVIMRMFWKHEKMVEFIREKDKECTVVIVAGALILVVLGILAGPVTEWALSSARVLVLK
ncbi:proton-translocating NADH-quinone oxidoreductase, chain N [Archaeoglobus sulfaticallidus PM70-1]|uniref:Proton-translocating NADH-quinone oxidoreductase, chain N n=1 Tax=Archaeoglobus sulfaticallidus PM70-1 TaxID=387631 RepID=N0BHJ0_9EURY|nr:NADH-quinone oxidoreductase subunit N [Archaeoglobus sulfaticallidus]AGK61782.1 proton-translocating NADH-quinone oxidoreductase, chain N [Archaeoglobus sulfaticallidus PM70-1]